MGRIASIGAIILASLGAFAVAIIGGAILILWLSAAKYAQGTGGMVYFWGTFAFFSLVFALLVVLFTRKALQELSELRNY